MGLPSWHRLAKSLDESGDVERAYEVLANAAAEGQIRALVTHAQLKWKHGKLQEACALMDEAERQVQADDWDTHFAMHLAYGIGITSSDYSDACRRSFEHLKVAAEGSGDSRMKFSVGLHYWEGLNMVEQNHGEAEKWLTEAAASGLPDIVTAHRKFLRTKKGKH